MVARNDSQPVGCREIEEILAAVKEIEEKVWYERHRMLMNQQKLSGSTLSEDILAKAEAAARRIEEAYGKEHLGLCSDFEWGMLNGKLSALRWVLGDEWDFLDT